MTPLRSAVLTLAAAAVLLVAAKCAFGAECFPSAEAAWAAHPGTKWATRHTSHGNKCWEAGRRIHHSRAGAGPRQHSARARGFDSRDGSHHLKPWKVQLFEQFEQYERWLYLTE